MRARDKWRFAIGTTSRVPGIEGLHALILDFDGVSFPEVFRALNHPRLIRQGRFIWIAQPTTNGWHVYTNFVGTFALVLGWAKLLGADPSWLRIGRKRGYLFLADKSEMSLPWRVERMAIWQAKRKTKSAVASSRAKGRGQSTTIETIRTTATD